MARVKSEFLKAAGTMWEIWQAIVNAVMALGGNDDSMRRLLTDKSLVRRVAELIVESATTNGGNVFPITLRGKKAFVLVAFSEYDYVNSLITDERFPIAKHEPVPGTIELVEFDHHPTSEEVLAEFKKRGLERPTYEHALNFGIDHPEEQRKWPIIFLHEPVLNSYGFRSVLVLRGYSGKRFLSLFLLDNEWGRHDVFAGVRK